MRIRLVCCKDKWWRGRVGGAINQNGEKIKTTTRFFDVYSPQQSV